MLDIKKIKIRGFLSYGDYDTIITLDNLGPTLITGEITIDADNVNPEDVSNGAGKSNIVNAILWCLFGKTMHSSNPGDKVINWYTKNGCAVEIEFKNGDKLTRTRDVNGRNELLLVKNGEDVSLGTTTMQQEGLEKELDLDWEIFCGSTFYTQFGKSWMEMSDVKRREALEREFHLDRIMLYAEVCQEKINKVESEQRKLNDIVRNKKIFIENLNGEIARLKKASSEFETNKIARLRTAAETLKQLMTSRDSISQIDIDALSEKWTTYNSAIQTITMHKSELDTKQKDISKIERAMGSAETMVHMIESNVEKIKSKEGKTCSECGQPWTKSCVESLMNPELVKLETQRSILNNLTDDLSAKKLEIENIKQLIITTEQETNKQKPDMTIGGANTNNREYTSRCKMVENQKTQISNIKAETNTYTLSISELEDQVRNNQDEIVEIDSKIRKFDTVVKHYNYIHKAYSDRRKIKSYVLKEYIPYLNKRISYYLDKFGLDLKLEFTDALGIKSNLWGYEYSCGGERKRMDVAIMLALFDLHTVMYGRQCNIVVLDEAERSLDKHGVNCLINIIKEDIAEQVDSVLIISHRNDMKGAFSSEIKVIREDRFSKILEVSN